MTSHRKRLGSTFFFEPEVLAEAFPITSSDQLEVKSAFLGTDPKNEPVISVLPRVLAQHLPNGFGLASLNAMPQQSDRL